METEYLKKNRDSEMQFEIKQQKQTFQTFSSRVGR